MIQAHLKVRSSTLSGSILTFILEPLELPGTEIRYFCVIDHPNPAAVQLGFRNLAALIAGCGMTTIQDSDELNGKV